MEREGLKEDRKMNGCMERNAKKKKGNKNKNGKKEPRKKEKNEN